ncbi:MAG: adenine deaminase [Lewinellaceae bacterium]|nr:adenine deaminase [Saprospiraceae bacterium]MCB9344913.1 adenine deaminase [Lewinellaceae bacterium]
MIISAKLIDLHQRRIYPATIEFSDGKINAIAEISEVPEDAGYLLPGFVDAHVHIESSMLPPSEFARMAVVHGTVATVSDPHEIANVLGEEGVEFMLKDAAQVPLKFCFGAPSCVPATAFETAGATLNAEAVEKLLQKPEIGYLSEMMNFPGVLHNDPEVMAKIKAAKALGKPIDGHAPGLTGETAAQYFAAGITSDHECFTYEEGLDKARLGVKILIREGSAARNFEALWPLVQEFPDQIMFCSDDKHPDDLVKGHINQLVSRALAKGCDMFDTLRAACVHPVEHYNLSVGLLREGDPADFIQIHDRNSFEVTATWINGEKVAEHGKTMLHRSETPAPNQFLAELRTEADFLMPAKESQTKLRVIRVYDGEIVTGEEEGTLPSNGFYQADPESDILFITVLNRYAANAKPAMGVVRGFALTKGALASSVAHDSHNIVAVGTNAKALAEAVNAVIKAKGGISATDGAGETKVLPLPIAGLMSQSDGWQLADDYADLDKWVKTVLGCQLRAPFMSLSFLALPVIPKLKMTDLGLFDVEIFDFVAVEKSSG